MYRVHSCTTQCSAVRSPGRIFARACCSKYKISGHQSRSCTYVFFHNCLSILVLRVPVVLVRESAETLSLRLRGSDIIRVPVRDMEDHCSSSTVGNFLFFLDLFQESKRNLNTHSHRCTLCHQSNYRSSEASQAAIGVILGDASEKRYRTVPLVVFNSM